MVLLALLRPVIAFAIGLSVGHRARLPHSGPAIIAANHNSHVDILALFAAIPLRVLPRVRPVGAAEYFLSGRVLSFVALSLIGILPLDRTQRRGNPLAAAERALKEGAILIVFPEGTRGAPEEMGPVKQGLTKLARDTGAPITPVYIQGAGRILPKGARVPVPFACTLLVGKPIPPSQDRAATLAAVTEAWADLKGRAPPLHWV